MSQVSALYVTSDTVYKKLGADCWDIDRNADNYPGPNPVICHPPCRGWGQLRAFSKPRPGELDCALKSIEFVRRYGGVVEHPSHSQLFHLLPRPGTRDEFGGFVMHLDQCWFGHPSRKKTGLYIKGINPRDLRDYTFLGQPTTLVTSQGHKARMLTPEPFAIWLMSIASCCGHQ